MHKASKLVKKKKNHPLCLTPGWLFYFLQFIIIILIDRVVELGMKKFVLILDLFWTIKTKTNSQTTFDKNELIGEILRVK